MSNILWKQKLIECFKSLDPTNEILTAFDEKNRKIEFSEEIKQYEKQKFENEAYIRTYLVLRLIKELKYSTKALELEKKYSMGRPAKKGAELDILVKDIEGKKEKPFMLIEVKTPEDFEKSKDISISEQLYKIASHEIRGNIKPKYLVYYTIESTTIKDNVLIIDYEQNPTFQDWKDNNEPTLDEIPSEYGIARKYKYANIENPDSSMGWRPLNKNYTLADFDKLRDRLHNNLWAGSSTESNIVFYHLIKLFLAKIFDENTTPEGEPYQFQIFQENGIPESNQSLSNRLELLYKGACSQLLNYSDEKIKKVPFIAEEKHFTLEKVRYTVEKLEGLSFIANYSSQEDIVGKFFESILTNQEMFKQSKGQFLTHKNIVDFIIYALELDNLAVEKINEVNPRFPTIIDPSCGSGTFLIEAMKFVSESLVERLKDGDITIRQQNRDHLEDLQNPNRRHRWAKDFIYGIEPNPSLGLASKVNMILHGDGNMNIFIEDGLMPFHLKDSFFYDRKYKGIDAGFLAEYLNKNMYGKDIQCNENFDIVLSNPPFSIKTDALDSAPYLQDHYLFWDKNNSENLFIERWFQLLKPKGRLGVVLPDAIFDTKENLYIRNFLYKYFKIKAIISLPNEAFSPYTTTKVSLLLAEKKDDKEIKEWESKWAEHSNQYTKLRKTKIVEFFSQNDRLLKALRKFLEKHDVDIDHSGTFVFDLLEKITNDDLTYITDETAKKRLEKISKEIQKFSEENKLDELNTIENMEILERFLKEFYPSEKEFDTFKELLEYVYDDMLDIYKIDYPSLFHQQNYCNSWWVFGEVTKHFNYPIFYAHVENLGYKRKKRREHIKDTLIKDMNGKILGFRNDFYKIGAKKIRRKHWIKKGTKDFLEEVDEIARTNIIIDTDNPDTILDYIRKAKIWSDNPDFSFIEKIQTGKKRENIKS